MMSIVTRDQILTKLAEFDKIGHTEFFAKYPKNADSKTTWLIFENRPYPVKSIFYSAENPYTGSGSRVTHDARNKLRKLDFHIVEDIQKSKLSEYIDSLNESHLAIDDLHSNDVGNDDPEYRKRMAGSYVRVDRVRKAVLARALGRCEYGSSLPVDQKCDTFLKRDGIPYLEAHHVIKLSEQGRDKESNVIALCANHHREAHFGDNWKPLQDEFLSLVAAKLSK